MIQGPRASTEGKTSESSFRRPGVSTIFLAIVLWCLPGVAFAQIAPQSDSHGHGAYKVQREVPQQKSLSELELGTGPYQPLTNRERFTWWIRSTVGPKTLGVGLLAAGIQTWRDVPETYGPGWSGFGKRYGMRITGNAVDNGFEDILGAASGEDPRYFRVPEARFPDRVRSVLKQAFVTRRTNGTFGLAYARFVAVPSGNLLSNEWRAHNENTTSAALLRTTYSFIWRMADNAFDEFWPDAKQRLPFLRNR